MRGFLETITYLDCFCLSSGPFWPFVIFGVLSSLTVSHAPLIATRTDHGTLQLFLAQRRGVQASTQQLLSRFLMVFPLVLGKTHPGQTNQQWSLKWLPLDKLNFRCHIGGKPKLHLSFKNKADIKMLSISTNQLDETKRQC